MENELEFFGTSQKDVVLSLANKLIKNYNSLGYNLPLYKSYDGIDFREMKGGIKTLIAKIDWTVFVKGDPLSVPVMLKRICTKGQKHWGKPDGQANASLEETYVGFGHFRYNGTEVCVLTKDELKALKLYVSGNETDFATTEFRFKNLLISARLIKSGVEFPNSKDGGLHNRFDVSVINTESGDKTSFDFYGSTHDYNNAITEIKGEDLLQAFECFVSDSIAGLESFEDFCDNFGYDNDSRAAERIYKECVKSSNKAKLVIDSDLYDFANELQ